MPAPCPARIVALLVSLFATAACDDGAPQFANRIEDTAPSPGDAAMDAAVDALPDAAPDAMPDAQADAMADVAADAMPDAAPTPLIPYDPVCENLTDSHCAYPWPSDRWLTAAETTETGWRLTYDGRAIPRTSPGSGSTPSRIGASTASARAASC